MSRELLKECAERLDALYGVENELSSRIKAELAKPEPKPEPIGFINPLHLENGFYSARVWKERGCNGINAPVYTHPPAQQNPLSDNQIREIMMANGFRIQDGFDDLKPYVFKAVRAIEQAHGIK